MDSSQMERAFKENQAKLEQQANHGFEPKTTLQRQAAEQRSANEQKINESAGEIGKKESTVQASSGKLMDENLNVRSQFQIERKEAEIDQQMPGIDAAKKRELEQQLSELREKQSRR